MAQQCNATIVTSVALILVEAIEGLQYFPLNNVESGFRILILRSCSLILLNGNPISKNYKSVSLNGNLTSPNGNLALANDNMIPANGNFFAPNSLLLKSN